MEEEAKEKAILNMVTPEMIEKMIEQKVLEILEKGKELWKMKNQSIPASTNGRT